MAVVTSHGPFVIWLQLLSWVPPRRERLASQPQEKSLAGCLMAQPVPGCGPVLGAGADRLRSEPLCRKWRILTCVPVLAMVPVCAA